MTQDPALPAPLHRRSMFPVSGGSHSGRHFCVYCSRSVDDFTDYVDWPCPSVVELQAHIQSAYLAGVYAADLDEGKVWVRPGENPPPKPETIEQVVARLTGLPLGGTI